MASFRTFFRTVVMLATLGLVAKAWYHYGPSVEEMKSIGSRASEVVRQEWNNYWQPQATDVLADDPRMPNRGGAPAPFVPPLSTEPMPSAPTLAPTSASPSTVQLAGGLRADVVPVEPSSAWPPGTALGPTRLPPDAAVGPMPPLPQENARLTSLLEHLTSLGVREQHLSPWGSSGELMRFSCDAPWASSPSFSRHFEAVAATPEAAVEQVAAEIEAWQRGGG